MSTVRYAIVVAGVAGALAGERTTATLPMSATPAELLAGQAGRAGRGDAKSESTDVVTKYLRVSVRVEDAPAVPGGVARLIADVVPGPKMHVYAPAQTGYIPVALKLAAAAEHKPSPPKFPPATDFYFEPLRETVKVYDKPFRIVQEVTLAATADLRRRAAARELLTIAGTLSYQACDDLVCYRPDSAALSWKVPLSRTK